jgi:hypothetical protein
MPKFSILLHCLSIKETIFYSGCSTAALYFQTLICCVNFELSPFNIISVLHISANQDWSIILYYY